MNNYQKYQGLSAHEIEHSRASHGANILSKQKKKGFFLQFAANLGDPVIKVLIGALIINVIFSFGDIDITETLGIAASIFLATFISTLCERGSEAAFERLKNDAERSRVRVIRAGEVCEIDSSEIVVGDMVILEAGERIVADGFLRSGTLGVDQSAFTGESKEIKKISAKGKCNTELSSPSALFCGSVILSGEGIFEVSAVGDATLYGKISHELCENTRESPLKLRLRALANTISIIGYIASALVALAYLVNAFSGGADLSDIRFVASEFLHAITLAVTVVVVAVPEGLPMMIAVVLSANIKKMMRDNVLVRKPVGIEAAGSMNILFTDKTGTLTEGKLDVSELIAGDGEVFGSVWALSRSPLLFYHFDRSARYNSASKLTNDGRVLGGNATDRAILSFVAPKSTRENAKLISRVPFDSAKKYSAVTLGGKEKITYIKGAPEKILPHVTHYISKNGETLPFYNRTALEKKLGEITRSSGRVVALAMRRGDADFSNLTLVSLIHLRDKLRKEAKRSVKELTRAGIQVVMITGDAKETALSIARECGIFTKEKDLALTGAELSLIDDDTLKRIIPRLSVVSRALPSDKSRLVRLSQELDLVVGMTGDGINDSPALKRADIGFAMGSGVQVAKDAGDIIILDNNLASIAKAVLYGRGIFKNIRKFIVLQLTMNLSAVGISMIGPFIGIESPVTVVQMLWVNIIMDTLGALAFAGEAALPEYMLESPKRRDEKILSKKMIGQILWLGCSTIALCVAFFKFPPITSLFRESDGGICLLTGFFAFFIFASVANCFNTRTERFNILANLSKNRAFSLIMLLILTVQIAFVYLGGNVLRTVPLTFRELLFCAELALLVIPIDALRKIISKAYK